jgi:hypothetical protein
MIKCPSYNWWAARLILLDSISEIVSVKENKLSDLTLMSPYIVNVLQYISNKMQLYIIYLYVETTLHVSGGTATHYQERIQLYLQHLVLVKTVWVITDTVDTVVCAPDDGWRYHPKHVEQFPHINKLCKVASCWIYVGTNYQFFHGALFFQDSSFFPLKSKTLNQNLLLSRSQSV